MPNPLLSGLAPAHPGEVLREIVLPAVQRPKAEIARLLGISRQHLHDILSEKKPVSSRMALRFAKMFGGMPETWLRMQLNYDLAIESKAMANQLAAIPQLRAA